jgi:hypothetical protein
MSGLGRSDATHHEKSGRGVSKIISDRGGCREFRRQRGEGDLFASAIGLGHLAMLVIRRLGMKAQEFPLVKCGGIFGNSTVLDPLLDSVLASGALRARISRLEISLAVGAARIAARISESPSQAVSHGA